MERRMNVYLNSVVKVYNDQRVKLGIVKEIGDDFVIIQGIFARVSNIQYRVKKSNVEVIDLLTELSINGNMLER